MPSAPPNEALTRPPAARNAFTSPWFCWMSWVTLQPPFDSTNAMVTPLTPDFAERSTSPVNGYELSPQAQVSKYGANSMLAVDPPPEPPPTATSFHFWFAPPVQLHCCTGAPSLVLQPVTSRHLPLSTLTISYSPPATLSSFHCWLVPPPYAHCWTRAPSAVLLSVTSSARPLPTLVIS